MREKRAFLWVGETEFMHQFIIRLQRILDTKKNDYKLEFWDTCALPRKSWQIAMEFPEGYACWDAKGLDSIKDDLLDNFFNSKELVKTIRIFEHGMHCKRNTVNKVYLACVLCSECNRGKGPGVIIYWVS